MSVKVFANKSIMFGQQVGLGRANYAPCIKMLGTI